MELIKQIKEAEAKSKEIMEKARIESAKAIAASVNERSRQIAQAALKRNETIKKAMEQGRKQGIAEARQLSVQAEETLKNLRGNAEKKIVSAAAKIVKAIKN